MKLDLYQYADVSTIHVSQEDIKKLKVDAYYTDERQELGVEYLRHIMKGSLIVFEYDTGYFVHTGVAESEEDIQQLERRYSKELLALIEQAYEQDAVFLRLDAAGTVYEDIKKFKW